MRRLTTSMTVRLLTVTAGTTLGALLVHGAVVAGIGPGWS